ncbi:MAG: PEGA domain-containing protein [bacterium]|nr:PEGA domain-containing protein [bacterium]
MKKTAYVCGLAAMVVSFSAAAGSFVRVKCDDQNTGAEVYINGRSVGSCPVDAPVEAGTVRLLARKTAGDYEQLFEKQLTVIEGVPQRVEVILSAPQLTAEGGLKLKAAEASKQLLAAEAGDVEAMKKVVTYYDTGTGLKKDPAKARLWRGKLAAAAEKQQVLDAYAENIKASAGDISAMESMATRFETGTGVDKDAAQAKAWRDKIIVARQEKLAQEKVQAKNSRIDSIRYDEYTSKMANGAGCGANNVICILSTGVPSSISGMVTDLISLPVKSTQVATIKNEAAIRPSAWGKPESLIARVSAPQKTAAQATDAAAFAAGK